MASSATLSSRSQSYTSQSSATTGSWAGPVTLVGRLFFVLIFLMSGPRHFLSQTVAFAASQGVPLASIAVPLSGIIALAGGLSILLGYRAEIGAWLLVLFLVPVTLSLHKFWVATDPMMYQMQFAMFMKNVALMGAALFISQTGSGSWSLDAARK
jgi:putative oxidoreductase